MAAGDTTLEQTLGLMTGIVEITRDASRAANALKTIGQRIRTVSEDGESYVAKLQSSFDKYGITVDIVNRKTGEMESTYNILKGIAAQWDNLNDAQKQEIGELAAGKQRITDFNALMQNFGTTLNAVEAAENSMGSASKENERAMDSLQGKIQELKSAFVTLATNTINSQTVKSIVSLGTTMLKFANSDVGQVIIKVIGLATALKTASKAISALGKFTGISSAMKSATTAFSEASAGAVGFTATLKGTAAATKSLTVALLSNPLFWGTVAITAVTGIINKYEELQQKKLDLVSSTQEEVNSINDESKELENFSNEMKNAYESSDTLKEKKDTLKTYQQQLIDKYGDEITTLTDVKNANDLLNKSYDETVNVLKQVEEGLLDKQVAALNENKTSRDELLKTETTNILISKKQLESIASNEKEYSALISLLEDSARSAGMLFSTNKAGDKVLAGNAEALVDFYNKVENGITSLNDSSQTAWGEMKNHSEFMFKSLEEDYNKFSESAKQADELEYKSFIKNHQDEFNTYKDLLEKRQKLIEQYNSSKTNVERQKIIEEINKMQPDVIDAYSKLFTQAKLGAVQGLKDTFGEDSFKLPNLADFSGISDISASGIDNLMTKLEKTTGLTENLKKQIVDMRQKIEASGNTTALESYDKQLSDLGITVNDSAVYWQKLRDTVKNTDDYFEAASGIWKTLKDEGVDITDEAITGMVEKLLSGETSFSDFFDFLEEKVKDAGGNISDTVDQTINSVNESLENSNKSIDSIQSAIETLDAAVYEYNNNGYITIDTLQSLLQLGGDYTSMLEYTNGTLQLSAEGHAQLEQKMQEELQTSITLAAYNELVALAAKKTGDEANSSSGYVAQMSEALKNAGNNASVSAQQFFQAAQGMAALRGESIEGLSQEQIQGVYDKYSKISLSANTIAKKSVSSIGTGKSKSYTSGKGTSGKKGSSSKSTKDTWKEEFESKYKALQHELNMEQITEEQYTDELESLYKKYFSNKTKYAEEYNKYEEEVYKKRKEIVKDAFQKELDELDHKQTMNMISERDYTDEVEKLYKKYFANRKEFLDEYTKYEEKVYESRASYLKEDYDAAISVATNVIDKQISELEKQKSALEKVNDETDKAIELEKLKNDLYNAQNQKNIRTYYAGLGWVWEADKEAISDAEKALKDFEVEQKTDEIDKQIDSLNELKDNWSSIASDYESQQDRINAAVKFGSDFEQKVLSGRLDYLKSFVQSYNYEMDKLNPLTGAQQYAKSQLTPNSSYANGTTSAIGGLSLVGEKGAELRVLNQGDGIIPAELTENLMKWGTIDPINMVKAGGIPLANNNNNTSNNMNFNISNLTLPNVSDSNSFISGLRQYATTHNKRG